VLIATFAPEATAGAVKAAAGDRSATRVYIDASYNLVRAAREDSSAGRAAVDDLVRQTVDECRGAGEGSSVTKAANEVSEEVADTVIVTAYRPYTRAVQTFVDAVAPLHWSNPRLMHDVRVYLRKLRNLTVLAPADICADVRTWAAGGFKAAPEGTTRFIKLYQGADIEAEEVPAALLKPYETRRDAAVLRHTEDLEGPLAQAEAEGVERWKEIMRGLALSV